MNAPIRFDWYQATVCADVPPMVIFDGLAADLPGAHRIVPALRGQNGYAKSAQLLDIDDHVLAVMNYEGNAGARPNVRGTGPSAPEFADAFRARFPTHRVTRVDACCDLLGADISAIVDRAQVVARSNRTNGLKIVPDDPERGLTYTIGAPSSSVKSRIYDKRGQLIMQGVDPAELPDPIVRVEAQANPKGDRLREAFAQFEPRQVFGASRVTRELSRLLLENNPDAIVMRKRPPSDFDRQCKWLSTQARKALLAVRERYQSPEVFYDFVFNELLK